MAKLDKILRQLTDSPHNVRFSDLAKVCDQLFGQPRQQGSSHRVYSTPFADDPRINIQNKHGLAKHYQVRQVSRAAARLQETVPTRQGGAA